MSWRALWTVLWLHNSGRMVAYATVPATGATEEIRADRRQFKPQIRRYNATAKNSSVQLTQTDCMVRTAADLRCGGTVADRSAAKRLMNGRQIVDRGRG